MDDAALSRMLTRYDLGVLVTLKRDGRPQLSNVNYIYSPQKRTVRVSITADRAKARNLARDPRTSFYVTSKDGWSWAVAEGNTELTPVAADPGDATVDELVEIYSLIRGDHPDWDEYRAAMVADRRLVARINVERVYGHIQRR